MEARSRDLAVDLLRIGVVVCATASIAVYVFVAVARMRYRFELEWLEGGSVEEVRRLIGGQSLYVRPSVDFVPGNYPPVYAYVSAAAAKVFGVGFFSLRLVSFVASLGVFVLVAALVRHDTHAWWAGIVASGFYAACYRIGGAWFDVARVDSLFLLAVIASIYVARIAESWPSVMVAAVLVVLASFTKQNAVFVACGIFVYFLHRRRRWAVLYGTLVGALWLATTALWNILTHGWFWYYNFDVTGIHAVRASRIVSFWSHDLLSHVAIALLVSGGYLIWLRVTNQYELLWFYLPVAAGLVLPAWYVRVHDGAYANDLLPAYLAIALFFGLGLHGLTRLALTRTWRREIAIAVLLAGVVQFALLRYDPVAQLPTAADQRAGQQLLTLLRDTRGDVLVADHPYYAALVGKRTFADSVWVSAVLDSSNRTAQHDVDASFETAVRAKRYGAVLLGPSPSYVLTMAPDFNRYYRNATPVNFPATALTPLTGGPIPIRTIYLPRR